MSKVIYLVFVLFCFGTGFMNLENNEWNPVELPSFITFETGERILPVEEWSSILIGEWKFNTDYSEYRYSGTATYYEDSTFVRKISYKDESGNNVIKCGGTVRGKWSVSEDKNVWTEMSENCGFSDLEEDLCNIFFHVEYGEVESDTEDYEIIYFNHSQIEIRVKYLSGNGGYRYRLTKVN
jgi:hypothetical protein